LVAKINEDLLSLMKLDGVNSLSEVVGTAKLKFK
jgi:hypothetical protein